MTDGMTIQVFTGVDSPVLVKTATTDAAREVLAREVGRLRRARHPGVVEIVSASTDRLEIAWVGVHTLETANLSILASAAVLAAVAETVADIHSMGIVHGRLDPSHVVLTGDGRPVLCGMSGPDPVDVRIGPADDVAAIGRLIDHLTGPDADAEPIPERRWGRKAWSGYHRRSLQTIADRAHDEDPARRPTARALANALVEAVPEARLHPAPERPRDDAPPALEITAPAAPDPATTALVEPDAPSADPADHEPDPVAARVESASAEPAPLVETDHRSDHRVLMPATSDRILGLRVDDEHTSRDAAPTEPPRPTRPTAPATFATGPASGRRSGLLAGAACLLVLVGAARLATSDRSDGAAAARTGSSSTSLLQPRPDPASDEASTAPSDLGTSTGAVAIQPPAQGPAGSDPAEPGGGAPTEVVRAGTTYAVGEPGDHVQVADWDCDGEATPAVIRPATGEVFLFDRWASVDEPVVNGPSVVVPGASELVAPAGEPQTCAPVLRLGDDRSVALVRSDGADAEGSLWSVVGEVEP